MIGAWVRAMLLVYSGLPLRALIVPHLASIKQPFLRNDARPQNLLHESSFYCTMMARRLFAPSTLTTPSPAVRSASCPSFTSTSKLEAFPLRVLFSQPAYEANFGVFREGTRYHMLA